MNSGISEGYSELPDREFLLSEIDGLERLVKEKTRQLQEAGNTIQFLESVIHKASMIAGHLPYLCASMPEVSLDLENASAQLQRILLKRET